MNRFVPFVQVEVEPHTVEPRAHLAELMQLYGFDANDLVENRAGRVTPRQEEAMKGLKRGKVGVLLFAVLLLVGIGVSPQFLSFMPPESVVALFIAPFLGLWLLVELLRRALPDKGSVMTAEGYFDLDSDAMLKTATFTYNYLRQVKGTGMVRRYDRVALMRRPRMTLSNLIHPNVVYRAYYYKSRTVELVLSIEPLLTGPSS